jgi:two-component system CheB/CheR fusion protein
VTDNMSSDNSSVNTETDNDPALCPSANDIADECNESSYRAPFPIVGVGASAGGLEAFTQLLKALPTDTGMAFVLVQHLAPTHASALAEILSRVTRMPVTEVRDEPKVEPNHVYVIPPDQSMIMVDGNLQLQPRESRGVHHPIDRFFRALAEHQGHQAIGVVLSGTATDGTIGLEAIKAEGGITFAQDNTAQHEGMPHSAIASGCVDFVLPPGEIAREIVRIGQHPYTRERPVPSPAAPGSNNTRGATDAIDLCQVVKLLRHATGVDFTDYKSNTLYRRVTRRMVFQKMDGLAEYVRFLQCSPAEVEALYQDILISVTSFFRNNESFEALKTKVFPRLLNGRPPHEPVRIWTLGCSTGQEAYSLAIAFTEAAEAAGTSVSLQIFATDLNAAGIETARAGIYPKDIAQDVSPERLRRFFTNSDSQYRIAKSIRDACVFSRHNVLADPPFSRIDMISCRNLLIYLEPVLQRRIMPTLHYALNPSGFLWLGGAEAIGGYRDLFEAEDAKHKIYVKKPSSSHRHGPFPLQHRGSPRAPFTPIAVRSTGATELHSEADRILLTKFAPPGVLVSAELEILQYRGDTGPYLAPTPGRASLNLLKMLREGLLVAVRAAVLRARKENLPVREESLQVKSNGGFREVAIEVIPLKGHETQEGGFLILFEDADRNRSDHTVDAPVASQVGRNGDTVNLDNARLTQELFATRDYLQALIEQQETANEELQSANEEIQSANEELQSTNEELETSKEEIQSSNEELATVNDELNNRNAELGRINNDLVNLLDSIETAIIMLGPDLRVRRFTPMAEKLLNLTPADLGRPFADIKLNLDGISDLDQLFADVLDSITVKERDVRDKHGRWYSLRIRPYRTLDNKTDGVVVNLVDVDTLKRAQAYTESIVATVREPLLVLDSDLRVRTASHAFYEIFHVSPHETENQLLYELGNGQWNIPALRSLLGEILPRDSQVNDFVVKHEFEQIGARTMMLNARRLIQADDQSPLILLAVEDITESETAKSALHESEQRFRTLFELGPVAVYTCDASGVIGEFNARAAELWGRAPKRGDTDEKFCGSLKMWRADGTVLPHEQCPMAEVLCGKIPGAHDAEVVIERPDGSRVTVAVNIRPLKDEAGEITGALNCFYDITERKHAEELLRESKQRLASLIESSNDAIISKSLGGIIHSWNAAAERLFGYSAKQAVGRPISLIIPSDRAAEEERIIRSVRAGEHVEPFESVRVRCDGQPVQVSLTISPIRDQTGQTVGASTIARDITSQKRLEAKLLEADRHKNEFLAMLAHELRNPLAPIGNAIELLRKSDGNEKTMKQATDIMRRQMRQMIRLIDDLLDVSRITEGKIHLRKERLELASVVNHAVEAARPLWASKEHELKVTLSPQPIYVDGDPARLAQVLGNLINNACRYTENGGRIELTVERQSNDVVISVKDNGIGIAGEQLTRIFDMFTQVDTSLERTQSGLGIGLSLVRTLVEMHHGTVEARSPGIDKGSEFIVRLPTVAAPAPPQPEPSRTANATVVPRRVLVVDDNPDSAESLAMLLQFDGHEAHTAHDGVEGVAAAARIHPDVILLDIGLPKMNGYEAARQIRQLPDGHRIMLVALTGWDQADHRRRSAEAGFNTHLVKPIGHTDLAKLLATLPLPV